MKDHSSVFDISIIGAGITGSAAACLLAQLGYRVALIERSDLRRPKTGESLSPECRRFLDRLNFNVDTECGIDYVANTAFWGGDEPSESNFIFNPYGNGLAIAKTSFEQKLFFHAEQNGVSVFLNSSVARQERSRSRWYLLVQRGCGATVQLNARLLIIATGRNSPYRRPGPTRIFFDKLVALTTIVDTKGREGPMRTLYIEALPNGWFYTNALPDCKRVFTFFTDGDLLRRIQPIEAHFNKQLRRTSWSRTSGFDLSDLDPKVKTFDARTSWSNCQIGAGWIELGDAAYTIDPLSGQGIQKNLEMVEFCVENIRPLTDFADSARDLYVSYNSSRFKSMLNMGRNLFDAEKRWRSDPFWLRRHTGIPEPLLAGS